MAENVNIDLLQQEDQTILIHTGWLQTLCRICGETATKLVTKLNFKDEFSDIFHIDIENEDQLVFPLNVCARHAAVLYRYRDAKTKGKSFNTVIGLAKFSQHSNVNCSCQAYIDHIDCDHTYTPAKKVPRTDTQETDHDKVSLFSVNVEKPSEPALHSTQLEDSVSKLYATFESIPESIRSSVLCSFVNKLSYDDRLSLIGSIFDNESKDIADDIDIIQNSYNSLQSLYDINITEYLQNRNKMVTEVLNRMSKPKQKDASNSVNMVNNAVLVEMIYKTRNSRFIGPISLMQNLTILSLTGSKTAVDIVGTISAGGKYKTLCRWLEGNTSKAPTGPPGDAVYMFDNEQVIGKTWFVKPNNKAKSSVITNVAAASLNSELCYQSKVEYHPAQWFVSDRAVAAVTKLLNENDEHFTSLKQVHLTQLKLFVNAAIDLVSEEQTQSPVLTDNVDKELEQMNKVKNFKVCINCDLMHPKSKRKCSQCKSKLSSVEPLKEMGEFIQSKNTIEHVEEVKCSSEKNATDSLTEERYEYVPSGHSNYPTEVKLLDPVFVNPNSFENLALVLRHIGKTAGIKRYGGTEREWLIICCDGLPYSMILYLTQECFICAECNGKYIGEDEFEAHTKEKHTDIQNVARIQEFDWALLHTGDGHYEMNLLKSFFELNWDICLKQLAQKMGWVSEMALKSAKNCYDNHKTWQMFQIFYYRTLMELVLPYVRKCITESLKPDADGFLIYAADRKSDPNFTYMFEMVTRYCQGILNFRIGIRKNNAKLIESAKMMTRNLFHGRNHPKYQEIELVDSMLRHLMPAELKSFFEQHESITKTHDHSKGQGYDFILEELNKEVKSWLRKGVPSDSLWLNICRNHDLLKNIKRNTFDMLKLTKDTDIRNIDLKDGIFEWRMLLRETRYLIDESILHSDLKGSKLHPGLEQYTESATRKRSWRLMQYFLDDVQQEAPDTVDLRKPVYVTNEEAEKYESLGNQPIAHIDKLALEMISSLTDLDTQQMLLQKYKKTVRGKAKQIHISFFEEVVEMMENALPAVDLDDSEIGL